MQSGRLAFQDERRDTPRDNVPPRGDGRDTVGRRQQRETDCRHPLFHGQWIRHHHRRSQRGRCHHARHQRGIRGGHPGGLVRPKHQRRHLYSMAGCRQSGHRPFGGTLCPPSCRCGRKGDRDIRPRGLDPGHREARGIQGRRRRGGTDSARHGPRQLEL